MHTPKRVRTAALLLVAAAVLLSGSSFERSKDCRASVDEATAILGTYGSIPKGVLLEGVGRGIEELASVTYNRERNEFLLNGTVVYANPVSREEFVHLFKALLEDDRVGVSVTADDDMIIYGGINKRSSVAKDLTEADKFLFGVTYGRQRLIGGAKLPGGYVPVAVERPEIPTAGCYCFQNFVFEKKDGRYTLGSVDLDVIIVPLSTEKGPDGGHMPDMNLLESGKFGDASKPNVDHINKNLNGYIRLPLVARAVRIGEATAFARVLQRSPKVDLNKLLEELGGDGWGLFRGRFQVVHKGGYDKEMVTPDLPAGETGSVGKIVTRDDEETTSLVPEHAVPEKLVVREQDLKALTENKASGGTIVAAPSPAIPPVPAPAPGGDDAVVVDVNEKAAAGVPPVSVAGVDAPETSTKDETLTPRVAKTPRTPATKAPATIPLPPPPTDEELARAAVEVGPLPAPEKRSLEVAPSPEAIVTVREREEPQPVVRDDLAEQARQAASETEKVVLDLEPPADETTTRTAQPPALKKAVSAKVPEQRIAAERELLKKYRIELDALERDMVQTEPVGQN